MSSEGAEPYSDMPESDMQLQPEHQAPLGQDAQAEAFDPAAPQQIVHMPHHQSPLSDHYHHQMSSMFMQQPTSQPLMSSPGEHQRPDSMALPFPQSSLAGYSHSAEEQAQHGQHDLVLADSLPSQRAIEESQYQTSLNEGILPQGDSGRKPRGRPPGSKNRKTILKEAGLDPMMEPMQDHPLLAPPSAKKRGRPPGSKNKKTLEAMQRKAEGAAQPPAQPVSQIPEEAVATAAAASGILEVAPRPHEKVAGRRGRPPGSKNKRTLAMESLAQQGLTPGQQQAAMALLKQRAEQKRVQDEESLQAAMASGQKRRGRPPGSRNRPREEGEAEGEPASKKQRGRPKGSKNRRTEEQDAAQQESLEHELQDTRLHQMGMEASAQLLLGSGPLSDAVSAAMHAVPSGNVYWGDAQQGPSAGAANDQNGHQHDAAMHQHMAGLDGSHVMRDHHGNPFSVSYSDAMQQPLSSMVAASMLDQQQDHGHMAPHMELGSDNGLEG